MRYVHEQFSFKSIIKKKKIIYVIKRILLVDIVSIGIEIYIIYFFNKIFVYKIKIKIVNFVIATYYKTIYS